MSVFETTSLPGEFWGIVSYFNPVRYRTKLANLDAFSRSVRAQGLKLLVVELGFGEASFEVDEQLCDLLIRRRTNCVLWHKERLLNIGLRCLPAGCDKVAWLDGDVLFENDDWVDQTALELQSFKIVQPFSTACWLPRGITGTQLPNDFEFGDQEGQCMPGMGFAMARAADRRAALAEYFDHGHAGFAWAARRDVLQKHGLFDRSILGGADLVIGQAMYGSEEIWNGRHSECRRISPKLHEHICRWGRGFFADVKGSVSYVPGRALHLWHGNKKNRKYGKRMDVLNDHNFDPDADLAIDHQQCWRWASDKPVLHQWVHDYFHARQED